MPGNKKFNSDLDVSGKIKLTVVPNGVGNILTYNTGTISQRTYAELISDMGLATTSWANNIFIPKKHPVYSITQFDIDGWNQAVTWGNHADAGYVPYTGATEDVNLGYYNLHASSVNTKSSDFYGEFDISIGQGVIISKIDNDGQPEPQSILLNDSLSIGNSLDVNRIVTNVRSGRFFVSRNGVTTLGVEPNMLRSHNSSGKMGLSHFFEDGKGFRTALYSIDSNNNSRLATLFTNYLDKTAFEMNTPTNGAAFLLSSSTSSLGTFMHIYNGRLVVNNYGDWLINDGYKLAVDGTQYNTGTIKSNGFIKHNSSNDYVLLGGGGHIALSSLSGGNYVTKSGVNYVTPTWSIVSEYDVGAKFEFLNGVYPSLHYAKSYLWMSDEEMLYITDAGIYQESADYSNKFAGKSWFNNYIYSNAPDRLFDPTSPSKAIGSIHLVAKRDYFSSFHDYASSITFAGQPNSDFEAQAGIYVQGSGTYGTKMYFATTNSHADGPKVGMTLDHLGNILVKGNIIKAGGTSSQFLKADGSIDSNTYLTSSALSSYAQIWWVNANFIPISHPVYNITQANINNWNTAFGWGDHAGLYPLRAVTGGDVNSIRASDTRSTNPLPSTNLKFGTWFDFKTSSAIGLSGASTYAGVMTVVPYGDDSGNNETAFRLAQSGNKLFFQSYVSGAWRPFNEIWHNGNLTKLSQLTNDVGFVTTNTTYSSGTGLTLTGTTFSVNYGNTAGTAAQGNDSRINNGQTAFGWGNHASAGYALANGTNATNNWSNTSSGLSLNPALAGKTLNASGQTVYLRDATYGQISGIVQDSTNGPVPGVWSNRLKTLHNNSDGYFTELAQSFTGTEGVWHRRNSSGTISSWKQLYDDSIWNAATLSYSGSTLTLTINGISKTATINAGSAYTAGTNIAISSNQISVVSSPVFSGTVTAQDFIGTSDINLKENIQRFNPSEIKSDYKLFNFKSDNTRRTRVGVIAQELEVYHPDFVTTDDDGLKSVSYIDLHSAELAYLKEENKRLKEELNLIKRHLGL